MEQFLSYEHIIKVEEMNQQNDCALYMVSQRRNIT